MSIVSAVQSQLITTLIEALAPTGAATGRANEAARAQLLTAPENGLISVDIGGVRTELLLAAPVARAAALVPGTVLNLRIDQPATANAPARATLLGLAPPAGSRTPNLFEQLVAASTGSISSYRPSAPAEAAPPSPRAVAGPLVGPLVVRQNGLAPLYADLETVLNEAGDVLPEPVRQAAIRLLDLRLPADGTLPGARDLQQAVARSGLTHEALLAAGDGENAKLDIKTALLTLKAALTPLAPASDNAEALLLTEAAPREGQPPALPARPGQGQNLAEAQAGPRPPTPRRDASPAGQAIAEPSLAGRGHDGVLVARTLLAEAEAALDRLTLSQYASLPPGPDLRPGEQSPSQRWFAEIPLQFAQGTAVLPLEIEREAARREVAAGEAPIWRVRFALTGEPVGPLQALVTLQGKALSVSVWAEREATSRLLHRRAPSLREALTADSFERAEIEVFTGRPAQPKLASGQFLDRRS